MPQESLKPFRENLANYKRTKNTKVIRAIVAALRLLNGEASIDGFDLNSTHVSDSALR